MVTNDEKLNICKTALERIAIPSAYDTIGNSRIARDALAAIDEQETLKPIAEIITKSGHRVIIDAEDLHKVENRCIFVSLNPNGTPYASIYSHSLPRSGEKHKSVNVLLPHWLLQIDHINGDSLDNRKENLRLVTRSGNCANQKKRPNKSSQYKWVTWNKRDKRWFVKMKLQGKNLFSVHLNVNMKLVDAPTWLPWLIMEVPQG